jgi:hypothetical protein
MIERHNERLARSTGVSFRLTRRALLLRAAALGAAWTIGPWPIGVPSAFGQQMDDPAITQTLEAYADTLIPGEKRFPADRAIAGEVTGAGAVQAGAIELMNFPPLSFQAALPGLALTINLIALLYAGVHKIVLDPTVPAFVALDFASRTALLVEILDVDGPLQPAFYALASVTFLAYHTAAYLPTAVAIADGHPGLAAIGFPPPDPDGVWRFPEFSYGLALAVAHPYSRHGNPA